MPYKINKKNCEQSDGDSGSYVLSYTDKKGKKHKDSRKVKKDTKKSKKMEQNKTH